MVGTPHFPCSIIRIGPRTVYFSVSNYALFLAMSTGMDVEMNLWNCFLSDLKWLKRASVVESRLAILCYLLTRRQRRLYTTEPGTGLVRKRELLCPLEFYADPQFRHYAHSNSVSATLLAHNSKCIQWLVTCQRLVIPRRNKYKFRRSKQQKVFFLQQGSDQSLNVHHILGKPRFNLINYSFYDFKIWAKNEKMRSVYHDLTCETGLVKF